LRRIIRVHRAAETTGLIVERASDDEDSPLERPVGFNPQKAFTRRDKTNNVQDGVGIQIVKLNPVGEEDPAEERMWGKENPQRRKARKSTQNPAGGRGMISGPAI
jgi:hypothetical protein